MKRKSTPVTIMAETGSTDDSTSCHARRMIQPRLPLLVVLATLLLLLPSSGAKKATSATPASSNNDSTSQQQCANTNMVTNTINTNNEEDDAWRLPGTPLSRTTGTTDDFWEHLQCDDVFATTRPLHNESTWMLLRGAYQGIVGPHQSSIVPKANNNNNNNNNSSVSYESGFFVPYYTGQVPGGVGRGVFTARPIAKDTLVWTADTNSARFTTGAQFRQFLLSIPTDLACDVLIWSYCLYIDDDDDDDDADSDEENANNNEQEERKLAIQCDLDDGSFVNTGDDTIYENYEEEDFEDGELGVANIGYPEHLRDLYEEENLYALRDIEAGEQILVNYGEFAVPEGWKEFGLA